MAAKKTKKASKSVDPRKAATAPTVATVAAPNIGGPGPNILAIVIDELGRLEAEMAPHAPKIARIEALRKALRAVVPESAPAEQPLCHHGAAYTALYGPRAQVTLIDTPKLVELIGAAEYAKFATTTQKALFAHVENKLHLAMVLSTELSGPRSLKIVPRDAKDAIEAKAA